MAPSSVMTAVTLGYVNDRPSDHRYRQVVTKNKEQYQQIQHNEQTKKKKNREEEQEEDQAKEE